LHGNFHLPSSGWDVPNPQVHNRRGQCCAWTTQISEVRFESNRGIFSCHLLAIS
jgi:hypothetical protein